MLYRPEMKEEQKPIIKACLQRLFNHNMWDEPAGDLDSLLVSAKKQNDLFERKGLTEKYVMTGGTWFAFEKIRRCLNKADRNVFAPPSNKPESAS